MYVGHTNDGFSVSVVGHEVVNESSRLVYVPASDHPDNARRAVNYDHNSGSDEPINIKEVQAKSLDYISEVKHTYGYYTGSYGVINKHQLMAGEVTTDAKVQPTSDPQNRIFYSSELSNIALERTRKAKDAVTLVGKLID